MTTALTQGWVSARDDECVYCNDEAGVYALADGLGPGKSGHTAARLFCEEVRRHRELLKTALDGDANDPDVRSKALALVERMFDRASENIFKLGQRRAGCRGMAATAAVLCVGRAGAVIGHVGDTRAYLVTGGGIRRLTEDHTLVGEMRAQGLLREDDEDFSPRNVLSRTVGHTPTVRADTLWLDVSPGDELPLCSYGMYRSFSDVQLRDLLRGGMERALRSTTATGDDGATGVLVRVADGENDSDAALHTESKVQCIREMALFKHLSDQELVRMLKIVFERRLSAGEQLCAEGDAGDAIWVLYSGALDVSKGPVHLTRVEPGGYLGELAFMDGLPRSATVTAVEKSTILSIRRPDFRALIQRDPFLSAKVMWSFMLNMGDRLRGLTVQYADVLDRA